MWRTVSAPAGDLGHREELLGSRVESDETVRFDARLHEVEAILLVDGHPVRPSLRAAGDRPLLDLAGGRIETAEVTARVVDVPDLSV